LQPEWPFFLFIGLILLVAGAIMGLSYVLGGRKPGTYEAGPYESGVGATDLPHGGISVEFFRLAVFFVIFDVEAVFLFAWAVAVREVGWSGYVEMLIFVGALLAALIYLWRLGSLDWRSTTRRHRQG
jgi:NADH-quinone oxidoreductase subunit A